MKINKQSLLYNFLAFLRSPKYLSAKHESVFVKTLSVLRIYSFTSIFILLAGIVLTIILSLLNFQNEDNAVSALIQSESLVLVAFLSIIYAPIKEELTFRLILKPSRWRIAISLSLFTSIILSLLNIEIFQDFLTNILFSVVLTILLVGLLRLVRSENLNIFFEKRFGIIFYLTVLLFGAIHISNYTNFGEIWFVAPFLFLPQLFAGVAFGYVRVKFGFIYAVFNHMLHNLLTLSPLIILTLLGVNFDSPEVVSNLSIQSSIGSILMCGVLLIIMLGGFLLNIYNLIELFNKSEKKVLIQMPTLS